MESKKGKCTYADHLDVHPEIITRENLNALKLVGRGSRANVTALATRLKVPNDANRDNLRSLQMFLGSLFDPMRRALLIEEKGIVVGSTLCGSRVTKIGRDRMITLEDGRRISPLAL